MKLVVIGDTHANPDYDLKRFEEAGRFVAFEEPDVVIQMGDWADMASINRHGTRLELETRRYVDDVEITKESIEVFMAPIRRKKKKLPRRIMIEGNHENFITRFVNENPTMYGKMGVRDLGFEDAGFERYPYRREVSVAGFSFVHHTGSMTPRPSRVDSPSNGVKALGVSTVVGHSHTYRKLHVPFKDRTVWGIDTGCLIHKDMGRLENWSCDTEYKYWRGLWVFDNAENGDADFREVRAETLGV